MKYLINYSYTITYIYIYIYISNKHYPNVCIIILDDIDMFYNKIPDKKKIEIPLISDPPCTRYKYSCERYQNILQIYEQIIKAVIT